MRSYNEDEYGPSLDFKKPKLNILSKMGKSFDSSTHLGTVIIILNKHFCLARKKKIYYWGIFYVFGLSARS